MGRKKVRILVVDDDENILISSKSILECEGYSVDTANTGLNAKEMLKQKVYNVALLDIKLPDMEGTELLPFLNSGHPRTRAIMITGYPSLENTVESLNRGADAYIVKPINPKLLLETIEKNLREQEAEDAIFVDKAKKEHLLSETMLKYYAPF